MKILPTLLQGSAQLVFGYFGKDPKDKTVHISKKIANAPNMDYDGDALNFTLLQDNKITREFEVYSPYFTIPSLNKPFDVSGNLSMQAPADMNMSNYLKNKEPDEGDDSDFWEEMAK